MRYAEYFWCLECYSIRDLQEFYGVNVPPLILFGMLSRVNGIGIERTFLRHEKCVAERLEFFKFLKSPLASHSAKCPQEVNAHYTEKQAGRCGLINGLCPDK